MDAAWALGIRGFDTADAYGGGRSETWIGRWRERTGHKPVITTKVFHSVEGDPVSRASASCARSTAASRASGWSGSTST
jgi:aryl-alcohol dehydrogenase-like predicted oxidoreductase